MGAEQPRPSDALVERDFGPYRIVRRLGAGGMADTFEAIRRGRSGFTQRVCLKLIRSGFQGDDRSKELFEREARLLAKLRHSHIVGVIDFGEIDGVLYIATELIDGADLQTVLADQTRLSPEHCALIGHDLAVALAHAHHPGGEPAEDGDDQGIIHRDISPSNVLISRHGEIKLSDFGLASLLASGSRQSEIMGKFPYMPPERLRGDPLDGRADLFALGVVLFEAVAGRRPFSGGSDPATIMKIMEGDHPSLADLVPGVSPEFCQIIESMIEHDPNDRPESAAKLVEKLDPFVPEPATRRKLGGVSVAVQRHSTPPQPDSTSRLPSGAFSPGGGHTPESSVATGGGADSRHDRRDFNVAPVLNTVAVVAVLIGILAVLLRWFWGPG